MNKKQNHQLFSMWYFKMDFRAKILLWNHTKCEEHELKMLPLLLLLLCYSARWWKMHESNVNPVSLFTLIITVFRNSVFFFVSTAWHNFFHLINEWNQRIEPQALMHEYVCAQLCLKWMQQIFFIHDLFHSVYPLTLDTSHFFPNKLSMIKIKIELTHLVFHTLIRFFSFLFFFLLNRTLYIAFSDLINYSSKSIVRRFFSRFWFLK